MRSDDLLNCQLLIFEFPSRSCLAEFGWNVANVPIPIALVSKDQGTFKYVEEVNLLPFRLWEVARSIALILKRQRHSLRIPRLHVA